MPETYREQCIAHKYAELPEDNVTRATKRKKPTPKKSSHKHVYVTRVVLGQDGDPYLVGVCEACGKAIDAKRDAFLDSLGVTPFVCGRLSVPLYSSSTPNLWPLLAEHYGQIEDNGFTIHSKFIKIVDSHN